MEKSVGHKIVSFKTIYIFADVDFSIGAISFVY